MEVWKPINERYSISTLGRVMGIYEGKETILKNSTSPRGYKIVQMCVGGERTFATVHRLMAIHFLGLDSKSLVVNHIDKDKTNNMLYNLEVCTQSYNRKHDFFGKKRFVSLNTKKGKFRVSIRNKDKFQEYFGDFDTKEEAYEVARTEYFKMYGKYPWSDV
jgi:hypothetical protein